MDLWFLIQENTWFQQVMDVSSFGLTWMYPKRGTFWDGTTHPTLLTLIHRMDMSLNWMGEETGIDIIEDSPLSYTLHYTGSASDPVSKKVVEVV